MSSKANGLPRQRRALIVVGKTERRDRLARICARMGLRVETAESVQRGLELLERSFDLVISDAALPDGDGLQVLQRAEDKWNRITGRILISVCDPTVDSNQCPFDEILRPTFSEEHAEEAIVLALKRRGLWNTRVHERYGASGIAEISISGFGTLTGCLMDISHGGMFIGIPTQAGLPVVDDICHFEADVASKGVRFAGTGIVRWVRDSSGKSSGAEAMDGVGIQFSSVNEDRLSALLEDFVQGDPSGDKG